MVSNKQRFKNKNVYITGGTSGIGLAAAKKFASEGASVVICGIEPPKILKEVLVGVQDVAVSEKQKFEAIQLDVSDREAVLKKLTAAVEKIGPAYVLFNSAGIGGAQYFEKDSYEEFDRKIRINLYGTRNAVEALLPGMKRGGGYILNVGSVSSLIGVFGQTSYASSKFGVRGFSEPLRSELKQYGISVSLLCPGEVDTPLLHKANEYKPAETMALNTKTRRLTPEQVIDQMIGPMLEGKFIIIPGFTSKIFYLIKRFMPTLQEMITDRVVRRVQHDKK
jgi:3-dehydrosphinganine reductase